MLNQYCHYIDVELRDWLFEQLKTIIVNFFPETAGGFLQGCRRRSELPRHDAGVQQHLPGQAKGELMFMTYCQEHVVGICSFRNQSTSHLHW